MKRLAAAALALLFVTSVARPACAQETRGVRKVTFPNGFRLLVKPESGKGLIALTAVIRAGALEEKDRPGIGQVLARTLLSGAKNLSPRRLAQLSDEVGGEFSVTWDLDYTEVYVSTTSDQLSSALQLLAETLVDPKFDPKLVEEAKTAIADEITSAKKKSFQLGYDELRRILYMDSPYRRPLLGDRSVVDAVTPAALNEHADRWFVPSNMVLAVVGDVTFEDAQEAAKLWFARKPAVAQPKRPAVFDNPGPTAPPSVLEVDSGAAYVVAGSLAAGLGSPGYAADVVVSTVLGGGKASRMFRELRERDSLAYELGTLLPPLLYQSHVVAYVASAPYYVTASDATVQPLTDTVRAALKETVESLRTRPITAEELERAKRYVIGTFALRHERQQERSKHLAWYEAMGVGFATDDRFAAQVNAVTLQDAQASARRLFQRSAMVVVVPKQ